MESLKIITRQASLRVAEYAFHYAKAHGRERVSVIHKANIMQKTDGLFLKVRQLLICLVCSCFFFSPISVTLKLVLLLAFSVAARLQRSTLR